MTSILKLTLAQRIEEITKVARPRNWNMEVR